MPTHDHRCMLGGCDALAEVTWDVNLGTGLPPVKIRACKEDAGTGILASLIEQQQRGDQFLSILVEPYGPIGRPVGV